ncbi:MULTISPECIES: hypothetical protein [unclassified Nocardioides]|uniref:hypothetical protein n=1 Tax=unclassified Nocardioides TaxID=2615069 RepID=UPI0006F8DC98|nr:MULTISPECIES: hypothetical protein [unclassified Nocardioides]KRA29428.1 hypothetical protein ASD81_20805 [Nocardioides sp. Root614]KRA85620.1 hypothetical protein ASD84_24565 [Nocardioides sp. Root682]
MADVILGPAGSTVLVDLDICVKTGRVTDERVTLRGQTTPSWVTLLLLCSIVGFLFAAMMTSRRYRVTLPFSHAAHDRWSGNRRLAVLVGLAGVAVLVAAATVGDDFSGLLAGVGGAFVAGGLGLGVLNAARNTVGVHVRRDDLVLTRAHPLFVEAVKAASVEPLSS